MATGINEPASLRPLTFPEIWMLKDRIKCLRLLLAIVTLEAENCYSCNRQTGYDYWYSYRQRILGEIETAESMIPKHGSVLTLEELRTLPAATEKIYQDPRFKDKVGMIM